AMPISAQTVGQKVSGLISLPTDVQSKLYVPLPEGVWQIVSRWDRGSPKSNVKLTRIYLAQVKEKELFGLIAIDFNHEIPDSGPDGRSGWAIPRDCTRTNLFFRWPDASTYFNPRSGYNCLTINHANMTSGKRKKRKDPSYKDAIRWVRKNTAGLPRVMIVATFAMSDGAQMLSVNYFRNPEAEGFPPAREAIRRASEWHYDRLPGDEKRLAYVTKIKDWAIAWKPRIEAGFRGRE
ncbi:MAG TPA: hypothetical protein VGC25_00420, partial [Alphaproteobacteria bacterium]